MVEIFPYIVLKSNVERLHAHYKYIKAFEYKAIDNQFGESGYSVANLEIAIRVI